MKKKLKKVYVGFLIGTVASIFISLFTTFFFQELFDKFEKFTYDMRYKWKYDPELSMMIDSSWTENEDVVVIDIDERSMTKYGVYHMWPRSFHGDVVRELSKNGASIIGFDILFGKADFGKNRTQEIQAILEDIGSPVGTQKSEQIRQRLDYDQSFCNAVKDAGNVIMAINMSDSSDYRFAADYRAKSTEEWRLALAPHSAAKLPDSIHRAFMTEYLVEAGKKGLKEKDALDGLYPELAQAGKKVGFVNVIPDADGVHRSIPLFHNFRGYTYPALSLQMAMDLFGTTLDKVDIRLGKHIDLGKPFKLWKDGERVLRTSFPGVTETMIRQIIAKQDKIRELPVNTSISITSYLKLKRRIDGELFAEVIAGDIPGDVVTVLRALSPGQFESLPFDEPTRISPTLEITRYDDETLDLAMLDEDGEFIDGWDGLGYPVYYTLNALPSAEIDKVRPNQPVLISTELTFLRNDRGFWSKCPVLRYKTVDDLIALSAQDLDDLQPEIRLALGQQVKIPIDETGHHIITYRGPARQAYKYISYYDVKEARVGARYFQHKAAILGSSATALFDIVSSPFSGQFPGVEIHATLVSDFLDNIFMRKLDTQREFLILLILGMVIGIIAYIFRPMWAGIIGFVFIIGHFLFSMTMFDDYLWIEIIRPIMTIFLSYVSVVAYQYVTEEKDKKFLHETFKLYLSPDVIEEMYNNKQKPDMGGVEGIRTAYFTDIQGFSTFSEKLGSPTKLVELLNEYLSGMTDILLEEQGTLDKYEGDAIIAFFGAPMPLPDHATRGCITALKMQEKLGELRNKWQSEGEKWPAIVHEMRMRIGVNSGPIVTGNMGSSVRMNYTMMGDAVNLAARLESGAKPYGVFAMCSQDTLEMTDGSIATRELDLLRVMGKNEPVAVHEILCRKSDLDDKMNTLIDVFGKGYAAYRDMKWDDAVALFEESLKHEPYWGQPGVKGCPSIMMKERCIDYKQSPPQFEGEKWDGVYTASSK